MGMSLTNKSTLGGEEKSWMHGKAKQSILFFGHRERKRISQRTGDGWMDGWMDGVQKQNIVKDTVRTMITKREDKMHFAFT